MDSSVVGYVQFFLIASIFQYGLDWCCDHLPIIDDGCAAAIDERIVFLPNGVGPLISLAEAGAFTVILYYVNETAQLSAFILIIELYELTLIYRAIKVRTLMRKQWFAEHFPQSEEK